MSYRLRLCSAVVATLAAGCGQPDPEAGLGSVAQPMIDGEPSDATYDGVVFIQTKQSGQDGLACTGTLVAPNLVITALHCVTSAALGSFSCNPDGSTTSASAQQGILGPLVPAGNVKIYTGSPVDYSAPAAIGAHLFGTGSTQGCQGDLAMIQLDRDLDATVSPIRIDKMATWNESVNIAGYGETETGDSAGLLLVRTVSVVDVGPSSTGEPTRTASPRTFVVGEGPCKGDSGGPAFDAETGALLGVFSLNTATDCSLVGIRNVYTSLSPFSKIITDAFTAAGAVPVLEAGSVVDPAPTASAKADGGCELSSPRGTHSSFLVGLLGLLGCGLIRRRQRA
jgi:hypothetical protein